MSNLVTILVIGLGVPAVALALSKVLKLEPSRWLFSIVVTGLTITNLILLLKAWRIVPIEHFSIVTCAVVLLLATVGLLTKTRGVPSKALFAAVPLYALAMVALDIIIHKS